MEFRGAGEVGWRMEKRNNLGVGGWIGCWSGSAKSRVCNLSQLTVPLNIHGGGGE